MAKSNETNGVHFQCDEKPEDVFSPPEILLKDAHVATLGQYHEMYRQSMTDPTKFWQKICDEAAFHFHKTAAPELRYNFDTSKGDIFVKFMEGASTNMAYNCLQRNLDRGLGERVAFYWEGNEIGDMNSITFSRLTSEVGRFANVLKKMGVKKGDVVAIYVPMILEQQVAMLACAWIGAIHSVVFAGFSAESLATRIEDAHVKVVVCADAVMRGAKLINLKTEVDKALDLCQQSGMQGLKCIMVKHIERVKTGDVVPPTFELNPERDVDYAEEMAKNGSTQAEIEWMDAEDPLFILYTSGSTGKPKGMLHTVAGYMVYTYATTKYVFDVHPEDVYWCTADCGWITGHSYIVYGPLLNGVTGIVFEGIPTYPTPSRCWQIVDKYKVTQIYTAPTAIRTLMGYGDEFVTSCNRDSLKILGTVGEPINPAAWLWYYNVVGNAKAAVVDTYWQTETGGHMLTPLPGATPTKPGSATLPFFGVEPGLLDIEAREIEGPGEGKLVIKRAWPGIARTIYGDHKRYEKTYFAVYPGYYFTGDGARRDADSYMWVTGRVDDLINVSGHLLSTAEIESALVSHPQVAEAAVVGAPHDLKGSSPYAFVTLVQGVKLSKALSDELKARVREKIGPIAYPEAIQTAPGLPKTRSGKIMRRMLRKVAEGDKSANIGDTSTLADPTVVDSLWEIRFQMEV